MLLSKGANSVHAKFIGTPILGSKKKGISVPKSLVANFGGPKKLLVAKINWSPFVGELGHAQQSVYGWAKHCFVL